ncbi:TonB-dependent receptor [Sphingobium sp. SCG-1]|uniref:TonB-dependent receptor domain-containing protein n=1 Tax=Sphingobium sp. SCG-1 TaxID=2072936 RepID=UPI000CD68B1E|nr:TonB-dependent receptor [Sphingobium sp. SCG-1]AUW59699.1 TonB-dependent receptor [Sphingobium sp. SCG-1]
MLKSNLFAASALVGTLALLPSIAIGQTASADVPADTTATTTAPAPDAADDSGSIVVTGSRIRRPNIESGAPITTVTGAEFFQTGKVSVGDILNELPQLATTFSQQQSTRFLGTRGLNLIDLRNLGTQRTLVLVNGRRHVAGDVLNSGVSPDINTLPTDLIESVDVITGYGSAVYGSDAIAGAVNFKLKQNFEGLQLRGQSGISQYGDGGNQYVSALAGTNFSDGRGNIAVNLEYAQQSKFFASGRRKLRQNDGLVVVDSDTGASSDGNPDRVFLRDIRSTTISLGGLTNIPSATGACGRSATGAAFNCISFFQPDGTLVPVTGERVGLAPNGSFIGGNGYSGREGQLLALSPRLQRFSANILGHFDVSDGFKPFFEGKYVRSVAQGSQSGPFFAQGTTQGDPGPVNRERIALNNPYLSDQARSALLAQLLPATVNANTGAAFTQATDDDGNPDGPTPEAQLAAQRAAIANGTFRFNLRRNWLDLGIRDERITRETFRGVVGVRGDFNDDWNYEVSANYGVHREKNKIISNVNVQRYLLGIDTTRNAAGQIVCRSQVDPSAAVAYVQDADGNAVDPVRLAADIAACQPINPFGEGSVSQAARDYVTVDSRASGKITQFVASGFVAGDLSQLFELPGGPIGFSVGGEYRRETLKYELDDLTQQGYAFYNAIPSFSAPSFEVKEVFGEVRVPILKDTPFFRELTLSGSGRISDYKGATGTVYSYGGELSWRPIDDIRFRGSYTRAIRAPNLTELYSAQGQNFAPAPNDPCSARNINAGSSNRAANCAAAGAPAGYDFVYTQSLEVLSGGNPNLTEETSDNYTIGAVFTPRAVPGLSLTVDYYDITVNKVISAIDEQTILNSCYDSATLDNAFCSLFTRAGANGGPRGEIPFQVLEGSLLAATFNFAKLKARGIDAELAYRHDFGSFSGSFRANYTRVLERNDFLDPNDPSFADRILSEVGTPKDRLTANVDATFDKFTLGYQVRWVGKQVFGDAENTYSVNGEAPQNPDYSDPRFYGNVFYHDIRGEVAVNDQFALYGGIDNLTNRFAPFGSTGIGAGSDNVGNTGLYENKGRSFYAGFRAKF